MGNSYSFGGTSGTSEIIPIGQILNVPTNYSNSSYFDCNGQVLPDPYFSSVKLLLHLDNNVTDSSSSAHTVTNNAAFSSGTYKFGGYSGSFVAQTNNLSIASSTDFQMGTGDFTVECWVYIGTLTNTLYTLFDFRPSSSATAFNMTISSAGAINVYDGPASTVYSSASSTFVAGQWNHVALSVNSRTMRTCYNGSIVATRSTTSNFTSATNPIGINANAAGTTNNGTNYFIDEFRVTKGVGRYTGSYTVPGAAFPTTTSSYVSQTAINYFGGVLPNITPSTLGTKYTVRSI